MENNRFESDANLDWLGSWNMTAAQVEEEAKAWGHTPYTPNSGPSTLPATPISFGRYLDNPNTYLPSARERSGEYMWSPHVQAPYPFNSAHHVNSSPSMVANYVAIEPSQSHHRESEARNSSPSPVSSPTPQSSPSTPETCPPKKRKVPHTPTKEETANPVPKRKSSGDRDSPQMEPVPRAAHRMKQFSAAQVSDWKHVLYNLLVESHNSDNNSGCLVCPVEVLHVGQKRQGFSFNPNLQPRKKIAELYAHHVRKETLEQQDPKSNFTEDLYKYYLRCAYQLMCKYFMKVGPFTYIYEEVPLFIAGESLADAEDRLRNIDTKHRRKKKKALFHSSKSEPSS